MPKTCILFCRCSADIVSAEMLNALSQQLALLDARVFELHDLCALSISGKDFLQQIEQQYERKVVVACYPRAVEKMLVQAGVPFSGLQVLNMRDFLVTDMMSQLQKIGFTSGQNQPEVVESDLDVPAWFPVIDQERCTACGKCARFCLFGVYRFQDKKLDVIYPLNCKNNCPACGRTCPSQAIIFPRLKENSALSGAEPGKISFDRSGGSMFSMLQERNQNRQSILRSGVMQLAEEERRKALDEMKKSKSEPNKEN